MPYWRDAFHVQHLLQMFINLIICCRCSENYSKRHCKWNWNWPKLHSKMKERPTLIIHSQADIPLKELQFLYKAKLRKYIERIDISLMLDLLSFKLTFSELLRGQKMSSSIFSETCLEWRRVLQWKCVKERNVRNEIEDTQCSGLCFFHSYQKNANGTSTVRPETSRPFEHFIP